MSPAARVASDEAKSSKSMSLITGLKNVLPPAIARGLSS